jgi:hypothetical protein
MGQNQSALLNGPLSLVDKMNNLVASGNAAVLCGPSCQDQKINDSLYQTYINAKHNLDTAPEAVDLAYKNYIVKTKGQAAYDNILNERLTSQAADTSAKLQSNFDSIMADAVALNDAYNATVNNYNNSNELYSNYMSTNKQLKRQLDDSSNDIYTNDRKSYYNSQEIYVLMSWHGIFRWIYIIILISFVLCIFFVKSENSMRKNAYIFIALFIYPFICNPIALFLIRNFTRIGSLIPKNVYLNSSPSRDPNVQRDNIDNSIIPPLDVRSSLSNLEEKKPTPSGSNIFLQ